MDMKHPNVSYTRKDLSLLCCVNFDAWCNLPSGMMLLHQQRESNYFNLPSCFNLFKILISIRGSEYIPEEKLKTTSLSCRLSNASNGSSMYTQLHGTDEITGHLNPQNVGILSTVTTNIRP
jgi:hypothetical protein